MAYSQLLVGYCKPVPSPGYGYVANDELSGDLVNDKGLDQGNGEGGEEILGASEFLPEYRNCCCLCYGKIVYLRPNLTVLAYFYCKLKPVTCLID